MKRLAKKVEREKIVLSAIPELSVKILEYAREHGRVTIGDIVRLTGTSRNTLKQHFRQFRKRPPRDARQRSRRLVRIALRRGLLTIASGDRESEDFSPRVDFNECSWQQLAMVTCPESRLSAHVVVGLCRDSEKECRNLKKTSATDGLFWRCKVRSGTVIEPEPIPRPLPHKPLPSRRFENNRQLSSRLLD